MALRLARVGDTMPCVRFSIFGRTLVMFRGLWWVFGALSAVLFSGTAWGGETVELGPALTPQALEQHRDGQQTYFPNLMDVKARANDNQAINTFSGSNYITTNALAGASGIVNAVQNSGNNNVIQTPVNLLVNVK